MKKVQEVHIQGTVMIQQNDYRTPRERITGELLERVMEDETESYGSFVRTGTNNASRSTDGQVRSGKGSYTRGNTYPSLAMVYSPFQEFENLYEPEEALTRGSLFVDLDLPFEAYCCGGRKGGKR